SLAPNVTETIFALGAGDRVVGVSQFCEWPPEARERRRCGGIADPNLEVIAALQPDLIVIQFDNPQTRRFAETRGIWIEEVRMDNVASVREGIARLGALLGREDAATSLIA